MLPVHPKIAVFSLAYAPFESGAEIAVREIAVRIPERRFTVFTHRFERALPAEEVRANVRVVRVGQGSSRAQKFLYVLRAWRAVERAHRANPFTAIWAIMASYGAIAALLFKLRHPRVPFVLTLQEGDSETHILRSVGIFYFFWKKIFKRADHVTAISSYLADFARRHGAVCPVTVAPNGVDIASFRATSDKRQVTGNCTIITTSRLVPKNGVDTLIRAFAKLETRDSNLEIIGDGPERTNLEKLAQELGVQNRVHFAGQVSYEEIPEQLRRADMFVRPSRSEGLGSSFLEAMAGGLPVIGTAVGGIPDFLKDHETGLFARVDDPADLAEKMNLLIKDSALRKRIAANGAALVRERYTWDRIVDGMKQVFIELRSRPRVLIATGLFPPDVGGPATYSKILADALPERGFSVEVVSFGAVRHLPLFVRHAAYAWRLFRRARRADIIFAQDPVSVGLPAALVASILRKQFFLKVVGDYAWEQGMQRFGVAEILDNFLLKRYGVRVEFLRAMQRFVARRAVRVIVPSEYLQQVVRSWGVHEKNINVIYNAVEFHRRISREDARQKLGLHGTVVLSAGRLVPWKGFSVLISVVQLLKPRFPDLTLLIAGDGPVRGKLASEIVRFNAGGYIRLLGALPKDELALYLAGADIFVLHTGYEGFSHQLIEAMAMGLPVVTTPAGGNREVAHDGENGVLVPYGDERALADALRRLICEPEFRAALGARAAVTAAQFTESNMIEKLLHVISETNV